MDQPAASSAATPSAITHDSAPEASPAVVPVAGPSTPLLSVPTPISQPSSISQAVSQLDIASGSSSATPAAPATEVAPTFKAPFPPAPTAHGYLPDIEAIMAGGHDAPEITEELPGGGSNLAEVVRDLKARAGFKVEEEGGVPAGDELETINAEMGAKGAVDVRPRAVKEEEVDVVMEGENKSVVEVADAGESSDDDPSSASSSSSDSEAEVAAAMRPSTAAAPPKRQRKRSQKNRQDSVDSDMSDNDINASSAGPKTENEVLPPDVQAPSMVKIPDDMEITRVGQVASVIDTVVVIRAETGGAWRVLDEGTLCCWEDKTVLGNIFETFGSVVQPFYSLRFPSSAAPDPAVYTVGKPVFYCPKLASYIFTRDIQDIKHSDASNRYDEEVGAAEMEWSDDEAEQDHKRSAKAERRGASASATPGPSSRQGSRAPSTGLPARPNAPLPYDSDLYTPVTRPKVMLERPKAGGEGGSDEDETGSISSCFEVDERYADIDAERRAEEFERSAARGRGARGRGGRGRGAEDAGRGRGRGGRGRGDDTGRGRGRGGERIVAALPARPAGMGLPQKPTFTGVDRVEIERRGSDGLVTMDRSQSVPAPLPPIPQASADPSFYTQNGSNGMRASSMAPTPPQASRPAQPQQYQQQQQYPNFNYNPSVGYNNSFPPQQQQYNSYPQSPSSQYPQSYQQYPQQGQQPPRFQQPQQGQNPPTAGHFNPRFQQQQQPQPGSPGSYGGGYGQQGWYPQQGQQGNNGGGEQGTWPQNGGQQQQQRPQDDTARQ